MTARVKSELEKAQTRLFIRGALVEVPFIGAGIAANLLTDNRLWLFLGGAAGVAMFVIVGIIPAMKLKQAAAKPRQSRIVE